MVSEKELEWGIEWESEMVSKTVLEIALKKRIAKVLAKVMRGWVIGKHDPHICCIRREAIKCTVQSKEVDCALE